MKKVTLIIALAIGTSVMAQSIEDSVSMGTGNPSYPFDVFYNLATGTKDTASNTNWHLAFAVRSAMPPMNVARAACVRINEARGINVYVPPTTQSWSAFDTTGWRGWRRLHDSDSTWDIGAFNDGFNVPAFNFGWGSYDMVTRHINGTKTFLIRHQQGMSTFYRKFQIVQLNFDTTWYAAYSNLDGSDSTTIVITKGNYAGKLFAYYNLQTKSVIDREPSRPWHLLWSRYFTKVNAFGIDTFYTVTGILQHPTVRTARVAGAHTDSVAFNDAEGKYNNTISNIGWDWKVSPQGPPSATPWELVDSLSFFVKAANMIDSAYKIVFTKFTGPNPQITVFNQTLMVKPAPPVGLATVNNTKINITVYPNPAQSVIHVVTDIPAQRINLVDMTGRVVLSNINPTTQTGIDVSTLNKGIYFVQVITDKGTAVSRVVVK
jgi:hypothetical protein